MIQVWVSEIMLQQTRVETVIPYYNKWMQQCVPIFPKATPIGDYLSTRFPTVRDLAASNEETINCLWKGLGYYGRAARLLSGAQMVVEKYDGLLPEDPAVLEKQIAGIGKYTAGAITSIAYGVCAPVVRPSSLVLSRIHLPSVYFLSRWMETLRGFSLGSSRSVHLQSQRPPLIYYGPPPRRL